MRCTHFSLLTDDMSFTGAFIVDIQDYRTRELINVFSRDIFRRINFININVVDSCLKPTIKISLKHHSELSFFIFYPSFHRIINMNVTNISLYYRCILFLWNINNELAWKKYVKMSLVMTKLSFLLFTRILQFKIKCFLSLVLFISYNLFSENLYTLK